MHDVLQDVVRWSIEKYVKVAHGWFTPQNINAELLTLVRPPTMSLGWYISSLNDHKWLILYDLATYRHERFPETTIQWKIDECTPLITTIGTST